MVRHSLHGWTVAGECPYLPPEGLVVLDALEREAFVASSSGQIEGFWHMVRPASGKCCEGGRNCGQNGGCPKGGGGQVLAHPLR